MCGIISPFKLIQCVHCLLWHYTVIWAISHCILWTTQDHLRVSKHCHKSTAILKLFPHVKLIPNHIYKLCQQKQPSQIVYIKHNLSICIWFIYNWFKVHKVNEWARNQGPQGQWMSQDSRSTRSVNEPGFISEWARIQGSQGQWMSQDSRSSRSMNEPGFKSSALSREPPHLLNNTNKSL